MSKLSAYFRRRRARKEAKAKEYGMRKAFKGSFAQSSDAWKYAATAELRGKEFADAALENKFGDTTSTDSSDIYNDPKTTTTSWVDSLFGGMSGSELEKFSKKMKTKFASDKANQATHKKMKAEGKTIGGTRGTKKTNRKETKGSGGSSFAAGGLGNMGRSGYTIPKITGGAN